MCFDQALESERNWLVVASTQCPWRPWLGAFGDAVFLAAFFQQNVARALGDYATPMVAPMPTGAAGARTASDVPALHRRLPRASHFSKALPNELLHVFEKQVAALPKTREAQRLVVQRVGQNLFRSGVLDFWEGRCAVTGSPSRRRCARATSSYGPTARRTPNGVGAFTAQGAHSDAPLCVAPGCDLRRSVVGSMPISNKPRIDVPPHGARCMA
jgi:hypothetical protein